MISRSWQEICIPSKRNLNQPLKCKSDSGIPSPTTTFEKGGFGERQKIGIPGLNSLTIRGLNSPFRRACLSTDRVAQFGMDNFIRIHAGLLPTLSIE